MRKVACEMVYSLSNRVRQTPQVTREGFGDSRGVSDVVGVLDANDGS